MKVTTSYHIEATLDLLAHVLGIASHDNVNAAPSFTTAFEAGSDFLVQNGGTKPVISAAPLMLRSSAVAPIFPVQRKSTGDQDPTLFGTMAEVGFARTRHCPPYTQQAFGNRLPTTAAARRDGCSAHPMLRASASADVLNLTGAMHQKSSRRGRLDVPFLG
ncbi:MAG: hypothetical protein ACE369_03590 [Roseovarius sp.]